jgi:hypothetical protein
MGAALGGGGGAVVVVTGRVGKTTPVGPNGSRDTTVIADTTTRIAIIPTTAIAIGPNHVDQERRSRGITPSPAPSLRG